MFWSRSSDTSHPGHPLLVPAGAWSIAAAQDRLVSALFMAALLHGVIILGVTFSVPASRQPPAATSLEVVILTRDYEHRAPPADAVLLAEQNLSGRGNAPLHSAVHTALPAANAAAYSAAGESGSGMALMSSGSDLQATPRGSVQIDSTAHPGWQSSASATEVLGEPAPESLLPDARPRELLVSANTRESSIASYLSTWKSRIERIGTLNFPRAAELPATHACPVLEVAIGADGSLREVVVRTSSGHRLLDQAAMEILRIAAPFEPFPQQLRKDYDVLRFAYEWRFGQHGGSRVTEVRGS